MIDLHLDKNIFNSVYLFLWDDQTPVQIIFGGSSSGKSKFIAQRAVYDIFRGGRNYLCVRNVKRTIKQSQFNEICKILTEWKIMNYFQINHSELMVTNLLNGYQIMFVGLDDVEKVKSITPQVGVITDIWIEEATEIAQNDLRQLFRRMRGHADVTKRVTMSFNPIIQEHWIANEYFKEWDDSRNFWTDGKTLILRTTYLDNLDFLDQFEIDILEKETDKYFRDVYTLGKWGVLGNVIFTNWEVREITQEEKEGFDNFRNGLDFGFSSDPAALIRTHYDKTRKIIYVTDEIYIKEMTNDILALEVKKMIGNEYVTCDSAEPKSIRELRLMDVRAIPARKGKDSINFGIDWLQRQHIVVDVRCQHTKNELSQYKWKEDKDGIAMKVPVQKNDHLIDALRYAYENEMEGRQVTAERAFM